MSEPKISPPNDSDARSAPPKKRSWKKRLLIVAGVVLLVLILLVLLLPSILSTGLVRGIVLGQVNKRLNGTVEIEDWSFGWLSDIRIDGIAVSGPTGKPVVQVEGVSIPRGLLAFTSSPYDVGKVTIKAPKLNLVATEKGIANLPGPVAEGGRKEKPSEPDSKEPDPDKPEPISIDVFGELVVEDGEITLTPKGGEPLTIRELNVNVKIAGFDKPIVIEQSAKLGKTQAPLKVNVSAQIFKEGVPAPEALEADVKIALTGFDLASVASFTEMLSLPVQAGGELTVDLDASVKGQDAAKARGTVALRSLAVSGDALKGDELKLAKVNAHFDVDRRGGTIQINDLRFDSPVATVKAAGSVALPEVGPLPSGTLESRVRVDLAALAAQLPKTLNLKEGLSINRGVVLLDTNLSSQGGTTSLQTTLKIQDLAATMDGKQIRLDQPITLSAKGAVADNRPQIDALNLTSSFCTMNGKGDLKRFDLNLDVNLAAAGSEAAKFVDLGGKRADGRLALAVKVGGGEPLAKKVDATLDLTDMVVYGVLPKRLALPDTNVTLEAVAQLNRDYSPQGIRDVKLDVTSKLVGVAVTVASIELAAKGLPTVTGARVNVDTQIGELVTFAHGIAPVPENIGVTGSVAVRVNAAVADNVVTAEPLDVTVSNLDFAVGDQHLREKEITLKGSARAWPDTRKAQLNDMVLTLSPGKITISRVEVPDWSLAPDGVTATIKGGMDVPGTLTLARDFVQLPPDLDLTCTTDFTVTALLKDNKQKVDLDLGLNNLKVNMPDLPALDEKRVTLGVSAWIDPAARKVDVNAFSLTSSMLAIKGKADLKDWETARRLQIEGTHEINFDKLGPIIATLANQPIELAGKIEKPLKVDLALGETDRREMIRKMFVDTGIGLARVKVMGIETGEVGIPMGVKEGVAAVALKTTANQGRLDLPVRADFTRSAGEMSIKENTTVLEGLTLTDALAREVIARINPIFKDCVVSGGKVGYVSDHFQIPLEAEGGLALAIDLAGELVFENVELSSSGFLQELLELLSVGRVALRLPDQKVKIAIKNGTILQDPLELRFREYRLLVSGTVKLDGTIDMIAELPVTRELVRSFGGSDEIYDLLKDEGLRIPIKGTAGAPQYAGEFFRQNVNRLMKSAGKKLLEGKAKKLLGREFDKFLKKRSRKSEEKTPPEKTKDSRKRDRDALKKEAEELLKKKLKGLF